MSGKATKKPAERVKSYRERMRTRGLRPVQLWLPDTSAPGFKERVRRQSAAIAASPGEKEMLDFVEAAQEWPPE
ncbi:antitoxin MazE family protein [Afifella pfennigii]|uniref:antitoxin MazE family protein n=1 Tax=Afifella pfennigii TaxID=209897 RepID=UPI00047E9F95|nr:antitoxin MazE family protein [Afifella pfennigii]